MISSLWDIVSYMVMKETVAMLEEFDGHPDEVAQSFRSFLETVGYRCKNRRDIQK